MRGEGTSYAYLPAADYAEAEPRLLAAVAAELRADGIGAIQGSTWTTDAPFRETPSAIAAARDAGIKAVEIEIAALYAFAHACSRPVICFALVTNQMAQVAGDFEKGPHAGAEQALQLTAAAARGWRTLHNQPSSDSGIRHEEKEVT